MLDSILFKGDVFYRGDSIPHMKQKSFHRTPKELVPEARVELALLTEAGLKPAVSANFTTRAGRDRPLHKNSAILNSVSPLDTLSLRRYIKNKKRCTLNVTPKRKRTTFVLLIKQVYVIHFV